MSIEVENISLLLAYKVRYPTNLWNRSGRSVLSSSRYGTCADVDCNDSSTKRAKIGSLPLIVKSD
jgi:hypothetical protein